MFTMMFLVMTIVLMASAVAAASVIATRSNLIEPAVATPGVAIPFETKKFNASSDTMQGQYNVNVFPQPQPGEWQVMQLESLREVEQTLDSLECHGVLNREVVTMSNNCFAVRWKC
jgi:opacity protein-like surface antigen